MFISKNLLTAASHAPTDQGVLTAFVASDAENRGADQPCFGARLRGLDVGGRQYGGQLL